MGSSMATGRHALFSFLLVVACLSQDDPDLRRHVETAMDFYGGYLGLQFEENCPSFSKLGGEDNGNVRRHHPNRRQFRPYLTLPYWALPYEALPY